MAIIEFRNGVPVTDKPLNGFYEVTKKRDQRKAQFTAKYWKLLDFTAFHMPEGITYTIDLSNASKEALHEIIKDIQSVKSVAHDKMNTDDFQKHYSDTLDHCCKLLRTSRESVINELVGFM